MISELSLPAESLARFCHGHGVRRLAVIGSALRDDSDEESDIDLRAEFTPHRTPTLFDMVAMEQELSTILGGRRVDLRTPEDLSRCFRRKVLAEAGVQYVAG